MISPDMMTLDTTVSTETPMIIDEEIPTTMMTILDDSSDDKDDTLDGTIDDTTIGCVFSPKILFLFSLLRDKR